MMEEASEYWTLQHLMNGLHDVQLEVAEHRGDVDTQVQLLHLFLDQEEENTVADLTLVRQPTPSNRNPVPLNIFTF